MYFIKAMPPKDVDQWFLALMSRYIGNSAEIVNNGHSDEPWLYQKPYSKTRPEDFYGSGNLFKTKTYQ